MNRRQWLKAAGLALVLPGVVGKAVAAVPIGPRCEVCGRPATCTVNLCLRCGAYLAAGPRCVVCGEPAEHVMFKGLRPACKQHRFDDVPLTKHRILAREMARDDQP